MNKISIISTVENGNLKRNRKLIKDAISSFEGREIEITLQRKRKTRSNPQNNFLWGAVLPLVQHGLAESCGEIRDAQSIYRNILLPLFAPVREVINTETGEVLSERITSSEMSTTEFCQFIMEIQKWSAEFLGVVIPDPGQSTEIQFN